MTKEKIVAATYQGPDRRSGKDRRSKDRRKQGRRKAERRKGMAARC